VILGLEFSLEDGQLAPALEVEILPLGLAGASASMWMTSAISRQSMENARRTLTTRMAW